MKRIFCSILAFAMLFSMLAITVHAADTPDDALGAVNIFSGGFPMSYLAVNGKVQKQEYTYFLQAKPGTSEVMEIPAYCCNPNQYGVPQTVGKGESIKYLAEEKASDPKVVGLVANMYPHRGLDELGLDNLYQAFYAGKIALWCYLIPEWSIDRVTVNPSLTGSEREIGERLLAAAVDIYTRGMAWTSVPQPQLSATPDKESAYPVTIGGKQYKQQIFTVTSDTWVCDYAVSVRFQNADDVPAGTRITDLNNNTLSTLLVSPSGASYNGKFKVLYPLESVDGQTGSVQFTMSAKVYQYAVFYALCQQTDIYGKLQDYLCDIDPQTSLLRTGISNFDKPGMPPTTPDTGLKIVKLEEGTDIPLAGAAFEVKAPNGDTIGIYTTGSDGTITIPLVTVGNYTVTEIVPPKYHLLAEKSTQSVTVKYGEVSTATFHNAPYGVLRIQKLDTATGAGLPGAFLQLKNIKTSAMQTVTTMAAGVAVVSELMPGSYEVRELAAPTGYIKSDKVQTIEILPGQTTTITFENQSKPGLRITKYDAATMTTLPGVTFEVYRDAVLLGQYTTDALGEITLRGIEPGIYLVKEIATDSGHVVNSTPQQIEVKAGSTTPAELIFFNERRPGMHILKVDSATMQPLANTHFRIEQVGGSFSKEYTTDQHGEIDLSALTPGAYTVTELTAPDGYLVDGASRVIQLNPGENAQFVFTNTRKPSLVVVKYDPQSGKYLAGATFRIAKLEDGSRYLDRVTDTLGRITLTDMEPGIYSVQEIAAPGGYVRSDTEYHVELFPGKTSQLVVDNQRKPDLQIIKTDAITGAPVAGVTFTVRKADSSTLSTITTDGDGIAMLEQLDPGVYEVIEQSVPSGYLLDTTPQLITLVPNKTGVVQFQNYPRPSLEIIKTDTAEKPIPDAVFTVTKKDGTLVGDFSTDQNGKINVYKLDAGYCIITEKSVPAPYILDTTPHEVLMVEGKPTSITIENKRLPDLTVSKVDSITKDSIQAAKFSVWYAVNGSLSGELRKIGDFSTDKDGLFTLKAVEPGWYRITETEPAPGYAMKEPSTLDVFVEADADKTITFENQPLNSLIIKKVDATDGHVLQGAKFRVRYFEGVSGAGGTTIGEYTTSAQGTIVITGLKAGTYIIEETHAPEGYIIDDAPKTVYLSGKEQAAVTVEFANQPDSGLTITKLDSVTKKPLAGAVFEIRNSAGGVVGNSNGIYTTDESGTIHLPGLPTDTYVVKETKAPEGYVLDGTPQTVKLIHGETHSLTFYNAPKGSLVVVKLDADTKEPLAGATFKITTSSREFAAAQGGVVSSNGLYTTDKNGQIILTGLNPDTYVVTETKAPDGYELDAPPQTVAVNTHDTQTLTFYDTKTPEGGLRIVKLDEESRQPIGGVTFEVTHMDGQRVGTYRTDNRGIISLPSLTPGWYTATERRAADGYELDAEPRDVEVKDGKTTTVEVTNRKQSNIVIRKVDSQTGEGLYGATFVLYDSNDNPVGEYRSDQRGYVYIDGVPDGRYKLREIDPPEGYLRDDDFKTIYVRYGSSSEIRWENTAVTGQIQITKYAAEDNAITGGMAGAALKGAVFEVVRQRSGVVVGYITTDARGVAASSPLPLGRYLVREVQAPPYYQLSGETFDVDLEYPGQIIKLAAYNKSALTGVALTKTGIKEVLAGSNMSYTFTVANASNVSLENFYWHDRIPTDAATAFSLTTGTYSQRLSYRILYKTNCNDYRVLASNLLTTNNYGFTLNALPLMAGEVVMDVYFDFGTVPAGFQSVIRPTMTVAVSPKITSGYQIINRADAGGKYQGIWETKNASWVTIAKNLNPPNKPQLPKTGY